MTEDDNIPPLTTEDERQWKLFSCGSRSLLKLFELQQRVPMPKEVFVALFRNNFPPDKLGGTTTSLLIDIARKLKLCSYADTFRAQEKIREFISEKPQRFRGIFVLTDLDENQKPMYHCRVLFGHSPDGWLLLEPDTDGKCSDPIPVTSEKLEAQIPHFLVFF